MILGKDRSDNLARPCRARAEEAAQGWLQPGLAKELFNEHGEVEVLLHHRGPEAPSSGHQTAAPGRRSRRGHARCLDLPASARNALLLTLRADCGWKPSSSSGQSVLHLAWREAAAAGAPLAERKGTGVSSALTRIRRWRDEPAVALQGVSPRVFQAEPHAGPVW